MKEHRKLSKVLYDVQRLLVSILVRPFRLVGEGVFKNRVRCAVLSIQNMLPTGFAVNRGDTVIQIGTPWPRTMKRFLRAMGSGGHLVIVEAMPENQERLEQTIAREGIKNVTLIKGAASNETRMGELLLSPFPADHKIEVSGIRMDNDLRPANEDMTRIPVKFFRLDDVLREHGIERFDYLAVTVNGAEAEVLRGVENTLKNCASGTRVYAKGHALNDDGTPIHVEMDAFMKSLGFRTKISRGEPSSTFDARWLWRAGDLYAWKP